MRSRSKCKDCCNARIKIPIVDDRIILDPKEAASAGRQWKAFCRRGIWKNIDGKERIYYSVSSINENRGLIRTFGEQCDQFCPTQIDHNFL